MAKTKDEDPEVTEPEIVIDDSAAASEAPEPSEPGVDEIKAQLAKLKAEHERSQAELAAERQKSQQTATQLSDSRLTTISSAIDATEVQIKDANARRRAALEAGDWDAESAANDELTELKIKRSDLNRGKQALEREIEAGKSEANIDPAEKMIRSLSPTSQAWARQHVDVFRDANRMRNLEMAHYAALGKGITPDSAEYFQHINEQMGFAQPIVVEEAAVTIPPSRPPRANAPAAPPSRSGATTPAGRPGVVRLTADELEAARMSDMTPAEYAAEKERLRNAGELGRFLH